MNQKKIHKFDPVIYPRKLWVTSSYDDLVKYFKERNGKNIYIPEDEGVKTCTAATIPHVACKQTKDIGVVVIIWHDITVNDMAHEAVHVASSIFDDCGIQMGFSDGKDEHYAYLVGWATECIEKAVKQTKT